ETAGWWFWALTLSDPLGKTITLAMNAGLLPEQLHKALLLQGGLSRFSGSYIDHPVGCRAYEIP
ncbi:MAG: hypothetical protein OEL80_04070, partial [Desulfuromonadales bacterium]|nr:hypothetical protein [Desulfuromonadales bacterium]